mmetsp:Transcript_28907/g.46785  ORF Transcript_28907/g.46785 Transcript_28907/m.46785 type:complete len:425 (-) Transcript_28907:585-1859(-)
MVQYVKYKHIIPIIIASVAVAIVLHFPFSFPLSRQALKSTPPSIKNSSIMAAESENAKAHIAGLSLSLLRELSKASPSKNIAFSPYSLSQALALTLAGAKGETLEAMTKALSIGSYSPEFLVSLSQMLPKSENATIDSANALWVDREFPLNPGYVETVTKNASALISNVNFTEPESTSAVINKWSNEQTRGKIPSIVKPDDIVPHMTKLILTNAVYLKAEWMTKFNNESTQTLAFFTDANSEVLVPFMFQKAENREFGTLPGAKFIYLPYQGNDLQMLVVVPDEAGPSALAAVGSQLTPASISTLRGHRTTVLLYLPRFKVENTLDLNKVLCALGMEVAFSDSADFSDMGTPSAPPLKISKVVQKVYVDVDEQGTEAAAVTTVVCAPGCAPFRGEIFRADRPFVWFILSRSKGPVLFSGRVLKP